MIIRGKGKCDTFSFIFDTGDVSWKNTDLSITKNQMLINLDYFPEKIYRLYIVNTGFFQRTIWTILTPILEQKTIDKVSLLACLLEHFCGLALLFGCSFLRIFSLGGSFSLGDHFFSSPVELIPNFSANPTVQTGRNR